MGATAPRSDRLRPIHLVLVTLVAIVLAACGGSSSQILSTVGSSVGSAPMPEASAAASEAPAAEAPAEAAGGNGVLPEDNGRVPVSAPRDDLKIVYTGSLQLVVGDLASALAKAKTAVLATGGYIGASQESNDGDSPVAT